MNIFRRKHSTTLGKLAEAVVALPHGSNKFNDTASALLCDVFEITEEQKKQQLQVELCSVYFSLWWFRYVSFLENEYKGKVKSFNDLVISLLNKYFEEIYKPEFIHTIGKLYDARVISYKKAYSSSAPLENMADLLLWNIENDFLTEGFSLCPVEIPVKHPIPNLEGKMACASIIADLWQIIDGHIKVWKLV